MFQGLSERLEGIFSGLTRRATLSPSEVEAALREIRIALLEADVALPVAKDLLNQVKAQALSESVLRSVTPGQQVIKIVHDALVDTLGPEAEALSEAQSPPTIILLLGLQGSGKTTTAAKLARLLSGQKRKVLLASLDTQRAAAQEQLAVLADEIKVAALPIVAGEPPLKIAQRARKTAELEGYDALILDSAGRLAIDAELMAELKAVHSAMNPHESLLVADAMTGQDALATAQAFQEQVGITGLILTRIDGDARGGAALSMRAVTGQPIKFLGVGEKMDALERFHPKRIASRILGQGDVVSLVEKASAQIEQQDAERMAKKLAKGQFDMNDLADQLRQVTKLGGMGGLMAMLPGAGKMKKALAGRGLDDSLLGRQLAIIGSMTQQERRRPEIIKASRKQRIAAGSGTSVQAVNSLMKQHAQMQKMMKQMGKLQKRGAMPDLSQMAGGNMPSLPPGFKF